jgi:membrane protease YdiL (CAAX protease family)
MRHEPKRENLFKHAIYLFTFLLLVWGFYRLIFKLPDEVEEFFIKPIIWILPVLYLLKVERANLSSIGITLKNLDKAIFYGGGIGLVLAAEALIVNFIKYGVLNINPNLTSSFLLSTLIISIATAISEEIVFRGYIFTRIASVLKDELFANNITAILWSFIHIPIVIFINHYDPTTSAIYLFIVTLYGFGAGFVYARTKNILAPILLHLLWQWPIILFR